MAGERSHRVRQIANLGVERGRPGAAPACEPSAAGWPRTARQTRDVRNVAGSMADEFYLRYYTGHQGKFGHEFLEFEFRYGKARAA